MSDTSFDATFRVRVHRDLAWQRLTAGRMGEDHMWLPGFDSTATIHESDKGRLLRVEKNDPPAEGTSIVVTLEDDDQGTLIRVVQSGFADGHSIPGDLVHVGWGRIIADLQTQLATGVRVRRFLRPWADLGAIPVGGDGGVRVQGVQPGGLASRLGIVDDDLVISLADTPVTSSDELLAVVRVLDVTGRSTLGQGVAAEWIRTGKLMTVTDAAPAAAP